MHKYIFEKMRAVCLNGRNCYEYNVYQTKIKEVSEMLEECEKPGVTVVTSKTKLVKVEASNNVKVYVGKVFAKSKREAEAKFFEYAD